MSTQPAETLTPDDNRRLDHCSALSPSAVAWRSSGSCSG